MNPDSFQTTSNRSRTTNDNNPNHDRSSTNTTNHIQNLSMITPLSSDKNNINIDTPDHRHRVAETTRRYIDESTFVRTDSLKSSSLLKLTDIITQNILIHPFIALRRTCQVNRKCSPFICVQPFSLLPFMYHQQRKQGLSALYKGLSSELLVKGITLGTVTGLANYADWPTEVNSKRYLEDTAKVVILRGLSVAITTPFLCSSVIETVQSVIVVKDRPAFVDCLREGFFRLLQISSSPASRIIPIWLLIVPTVFYHIAHSTLKNIAENFVEMFKLTMNHRSTSSILSPSKNRKRYNSPSIYSRRNRNNLDPTNESSLWQRSDRLDITDNTIDYDAEPSLDTTDIDNTHNNIEFDSSKISTSLIASFIADVTLLPVETILNRLYIQGTRTIIDNCDETTVVLPVLTNYEGFSDCYQSICRFEGNLGLFKGLGAIVLQYSVHFIIFRSLYYLLRELQSNVRDGNNNALHQRGFSNNTRSSTNRTADPFSARNNHDPSLKPNNRDYMRNTLHSTPNIIGAGGGANIQNYRQRIAEDDNYRL